MVVFAVFGLAFLVVLTREVSRKKNTTNQYNQLPTSTVSYNAAIQIKNDRRLLDSVLDKSSYQIQSKDVSNSQKKVATYCVIDQALVDN